MKKREKVLAIKEKRVNNQLKLRLKQRAKPKALKTQALPQRYNLTLELEE